MRSPKQSEIDTGVRDLKFLKAQQMCVPCDKAAAVPCVLTPAG
jgi:hypothetical protein